MIFNNITIQKNFNGRSPLHFAAMQSDPQSLKLLLALENIDVNLEDMVLI